VVHRRLGRSGLTVSPIGFGAFKIGRNEGIKYPQGYDLPDEAAATRLLNAVLDLGINYVDTAPAYGLSEQRIGRALAHRRRDYVLSTKVGETRHAGRSTYDFSSGALRASVERSLRRLRTDAVDLVLIHSDGDDLAILEGTDAVQTLQDLRSEGLVRAIGLSAKTVEGARAALAWADTLMLEYHLDDRASSAVISEASAADVGVVVKKGLAAGRLDPPEAVRFVLGTPGVGSLVVGSLNIDHLKDNVRVADGL
jgi:aryl-alcohol dehydrogenase-like predicted oxidoreductase